MVAPCAGADRGTSVAKVLTSGISSQGLFAAVAAASRGRCCSTPHGGRCCRACSTLNQRGGAASPGADASLCCQRITTADSEGTDTRCRLSPPEPLLEARELLRQAAAEAARAEAIRSRRFSAGTAPATFEAPHATGASAPSAALLLRSRASSAASSPASVRGSRGRTPSPARSECPSTIGPRTPTAVPSGASTTCEGASVSTLASTAPVTSGAPTTFSSTARRGGSREPPQGTTAAATSVPVASGGALKDPSRRSSGVGVGSRGGYLGLGAPAFKPPPHNSAGAKLLPQTTQVWKSPHRNGSKGLLQHGKVVTTPIQGMVKKPWPSAHSPSVHVSRGRGGG